MNAVGSCLPEELLEKVQKRSNRNEHTRFPYRLKEILEWAGDDDNLRDQCGCGWISDTEFFIIKDTLCNHMKIKKNTLNVNLNNLGFKQFKKKNGQITYWTHNDFVRGTKTESFDSIRNIKKKNESLMAFSKLAIFLPLLDDIALFKMSEKDIKIFKKGVIVLWDNIVSSKLIFAVSLNDFLSVLDSLIHQKCSLTFSDSYEIQTVLQLSIPDIVSIFDFAVFMARFGPLQTLTTKISQFIRFAKSIGNETSKMPFFYSLTFHNCFTFKNQIGGEYHAYNQPHILSSNEFLVDEDERIYNSWDSLKEQNAEIFASHYY